MNTYQVNYTVTDKECLAALLAVRKFRPNVEGMPFTCITDHASFKWLMSMNDLSGRLVRWLQPQRFHFNIEHHEGSENVVADTLSRCVEELPDPTELFGFKTTEFTGEEYRELVIDVEQNLANLLKSRNHPINISFADLPEIEESLCNAIHSATGEAPFFTLFGHQVRKNLETAYEPTE